MGYTWTNSSWQRMEAIGRQEIAYSKLARARFFMCAEILEAKHGKCREDRLLLLRYNKLKLFLDGYVFLEFNLTRSTSYSRYFSYSCYEVVRFLFFDVMGQRDHSLFFNVLCQVINLDRTPLSMVQDLIHDSLVFIAHDVEPWNICDSFGDANHCTFNFLGNNSYGFDGSSFSLLGDHCDKFQVEVVEHYQYVLTSLDTYVKNLVEQILVDKPLLVVKGLLEHLWHALKFFFVEISFKNFI
ncbi:hypothetical protein M9H77_03021 [Catharanthus roseus]|uniref:Uncharacterized protein n=1 Tax=Catharanthus roseus TaxID=4058 RepID=A0ACC0CAJ4_CATRO|nr:hypothetical protein M9H77_03021 [Catharanthus roseus]